jgi:N-acetylneuraminic acid mutarotase
MLRRRVFAKPVRESSTVALRRAVIETLEGRQLMHAGHEHVTVKVDFQLAPTPLFPSYVADVGLTYSDRGNGFTYGWNKAHTDTARDRNSAKSPDERYDTFITMKSNARWEIALPNGEYDVHLVAGDPITWVNRRYAVNVEGNLAFDAVPTTANRWVEGTLTVTVTDGKLTLTSAPNALSNNLAFIDIATHDDGPAATEAPAAPSDTDALALSASQIRVRWTDNAGNEDGFRIYRKEGEAGTWELIDEVAADETEYMDDGLAAGTEYVYRVAAFNDIGESAFSNEDGSTTFESTPTGTTIDWTKVAPSPVKRAESNGAVVNGKLYVLGGLFVSNGNILAMTRSDVYDPATNKWTRIADCPDKVTHSGIVVVGDTIWLIGGYFGDHPGPAGKKVLKYNTTTNSWSRGPDLPFSRGAGGAALLDGKIHFFGGMGYDRTWESSSHWVLDLNNQGAGWASKAELLNPRNHTSGAAVGGYVYCIGGQYNQEENQIAQRDIHRYDPTTDTWEKVAELPTVRSHTNASTFVWNNKIMIIGGETGFGQGLRNVTVWDPVANTFTEMSPLPEPRSTSVAGVLPDGRLISATGNTPSPSVETYIGTIS